MGSTNVKNTIKCGKESKGITLIALIVTVIVLLILSGVSISLLTGSNSILKQSEKVQFQTYIATLREELELARTAQNLDELGKREKIQEVTDYNTLHSLMKDFRVEYEGKLAVKNDKLVYIGVETKQKLGLEITETDKGEYKKALEMDLLEDDELIDDDILEEYQPFITEWTVEAGDSITLPIIDYVHNKYNFTVDYGDGTEIKTVDSYLDEDKMHIYEKAGTYIVTIKGQCPAFCFSGSPTSKEKITKIVQWGNVFKNEGGLRIVLYANFAGCINLKGPIPSPTKNTFAKVTDISSLFRDCTSLTGEIPENLFKNCTNAIAFQNTFGGCTNLEEIPEELFSNCMEAVNFCDTFAGCISLSEIPDNLFTNCNKVYIFRETFLNCKKLTKIGKIFLKEM